MFTNYLVMFSFRSVIKILVGDCFNKMVWKLSHGDSEPEHQDHSLHSLVDHGLDRVDLKIEDHQEDLGIHSLVCLDPFVKIR